MLAALLLVNALFRPYAGLVHDSRFYAVQVLDRLVPGSYADDLYLRYGSQDSFSAFSWLAGPVVQALGLPAAFFVLYLCSNAFFFFALQRLVRVLVKPRAMAALALVYVAVNPIAFGGLKVFHVHESFLTPRLLANGLVLLAFERLLLGRSLASLALLTVAMLLHPLMACGGVLVWVCWNLLSRLSPRVIAVLAVSGSLAVTLVFAWQPLGTALFGHMDAAWQDAAHAANFQTLPEEWTLRDWLRIGVAFAILAVARWNAARNGRIRRLLDSVIAVAAVGLLVGCIAPHVPYKLLVQGQPYRALWMLQLLQVPLLFAFIASCQRRGLRPGRAAGLVLVPALAYVTMTAWQVLAATLLLSVAYVWKRTVAHDRTKAPVWKLAIVASLTVVGGPAIASAIHAWQAFSPVLPPVLRVQTVPLALGPFLTWLIAIAALMIANRLLTTHHRFRSAMLAAGLAVQVGCFAIPHSSLYRWLGVERTEDVEFIAQFLRQRRSDDSGLPTVYWTAANLEDIWFALPAKSFFVTQQVAGNMFNRGTAIEGDRRAHVVSDFDLEAWHASDYGLSEWKRRSLERTYGQALDAALPTLEDLFRLCQEDGLDVVILSQDFEGWSACGNGRWFIYDCRRIRESLAARLAPSVDGSQGPARDTLTGGADRADRGKSETTPSGVSPPPDFESPVFSPAAP